MENNPNQAVTTSKTPVQPQPVSTPVDNQKNFFPIILGVLVLSIVVGGGAYYLEMQRGDVNQPVENTNTYTNNQPLPTQPETNSSPAPKEVTWKTESVQIKKETAASGSENINLAIQLPSDWTLKTVSRASNPNNLIKNCADYVLISADATAKLTISPVCTGWAAEYSGWPQSAVTIKEEKNVGTDGHTTYTVRYLDSATKQYKYVEGEKGTSNKITDAILIRYNLSTGNFLPTNITLNYSGSDKDSILKITDQIVTTLKAQ